jgi:ribonuclease HI
MIGQVYCDGGSRGNPGPAAAAAVVIDPSGRVLAQKTWYQKRATNNEAEYQGLLLGLELARNLGLTQALIRMDSELVVRQVEGIYRVKQPHLRELWEAAQRQLAQLASWEIQHVPRNLNQAADALVNQVLDRQAKEPGKL